MAGKRGRGKKTESIAVEAADSTSIDDQEEQNGGEAVETIKSVAVAKKGGKGKKEIVEKVKRHSKDKKSEINGDFEEKKEEIEIKKKGRPKKEANGKLEAKVQEDPMPIKKGKKKAPAVEATDLEQEEEINAEAEDKEKTKKSTVSRNKKPGRKRALDTALPDNEILDESETEKQKRDKGENSLADKTKEKDSKSAKGGRGKKRINTEEIANNALEDESAEEKVVEPVAKKGRKPKVTAKTELEKITENNGVVEKKAKANDTETFYEAKDFELNKEYTLKISSWNVGGLRSWIKKGGLKYVEFENPDIFCLQETKCTEDMIPSEARIAGYHPYWHCEPGGYAGVAIYSRKMPINVEYGIGDEEQDLDGRIMTAEYEKFFLINVYVPNAGRKLVTLPKRMRWDSLFHNYIIKLNKKKPVIICGDMNVSHQEIDLANPKTNKKNAGFTQEERDGMTKMLSLGFVDSFRYFYPDKTQAYTFWTYMRNARSKNVGWRLDYFIVSERIINKVVESTIRSKVMGSDHCPITLFLKN
ncbi:DNA-(apurinic or apyrimidinic site) endonuclease [Condylostylus longicornis]|uniref:DNA-(apurinic or apyrimidinic site) endonuclease n=1 Tax=Condylostylus longicornis TaxID=2530218 RepID=UPI00244E27AA|nr:DNA-(apurinic or apyrimidinic site) endonuclease [Condylostylus longicornis]